MAHPMASQARASMARRLKALGAKAGKPWGRSAMAMKAPGKKSLGPNDGRQVPYFYADGGSVVGDSAPRNAGRATRPSGDKSKKKGGHTTNVVIAIPPKDKTPVPVPRPVPVPMGGGAPPPVAPRPPIPPAAAAPVVPAGGPPIPPPMPPRPPIRPPVGAAPMKRGGAVKLAVGGIGGPPASPQVRPPGGLPAQAAPRATTALAARPALPVQAMGARPFKRGGDIKAKQTYPSTEGGHAQDITTRFTPRHDFDDYGAMGRTGPSLGEAQTDEVGATRRMKESLGDEDRSIFNARKRGGGVDSAFDKLGKEPTYKGGKKEGYARGGDAHEDEAQDKALIKKMMKKKMAKGGAVYSGDSGTGGYKNVHAAAGGGKGRLEKRKLYG